MIARRVAAAIIGEEAALGITMGHDGIGDLGAGDIILEDKVFVGQFCLVPQGDQGFAGSGLLYVYVVGERAEEVDRHAGVERDLD